MTPQRVTIITLGVEDLERSKTFYADLGWEPIKSDEAIVFYQLNGCILALFGQGALAEDQGRPGAALGTGAITLAQNFGSEAGVDTAFSQAIKAGAGALKPPEKVFWGGYSGYYTDPDNHVWEVAYNPFSPLASDGSLIMRASE